jgi:hypothetical protein
MKYETKKVLLLNSTYEVLNFITEKKALKLFVKGKVDIISTWSDIEFLFQKEIIKFPATLRLKYFVKKRYTQLIFSRKSVFKRDRYCCQYCGKYLKSGQITMDHVIPKSAGGQSTFSNCVTSCYGCNSKKGNKTPEQAEMTLLTYPTIPLGYIHYVSEQDHWHDDWNVYLSK